MKGLTLALVITSAALAAGSALGCGGAAQGPVSADHDLPVPATEARAELRLKIDLAPAQGCEEAFDLSLYKDRGVDLVQWDDSSGACAGRVIIIRYLPRRTRAEDLVAAARAIAVKVEVVAKK